MDFDLFKELVGEIFSGAFRIVWFDGGSFLRAYRHKFEINSLKIYYDERGLFFFSAVALAGSLETVDHENLLSIRYFKRRIFGAEGHYYHIDLSHPDSIGECKEFVKRWDYKFGRGKSDSGAGSCGGGHGVL